MRQSRKIERIEVSDLFWRDIGQWRGHGDYYPIRRAIAEMVMHASRGEPAGDKPFTGGNNTWTGIRHRHLPAKLICFTMYSDEYTMRLCAVKKHDFYGFRNERKSRADDAARKIRGAFDRPPARSPEWSSIRWENPSELLAHPEVHELSPDALTALHTDIIREQDGLERLEKFLQRPSTPAADETIIMHDWMEALCLVQKRIEDLLVALAMRRDEHLTPAEFEPWLEGPGM